ncbi:neuroepithelial cell-transforming gene 1 protein-like isoform X15 [Oncorhynchus keta]|uniref:neuroepithelial cell-transforming gene 1 protein-like isoform X11 n=1 Tax=Oncorhynchus keta TaxID=8018 RepID=UPI00227A7092|nr:neuroepithelial cell-transforming gene 1 protein-like isoform X11 [Oncorhynchus keta]XP_052322394.1 neuroepithelial cell-transforming gene 1 protein-like isoform X12 [Oncorhynchus keta]XP_052322395.1 neuroepithelial cell-transforming gene 1 protein-like isoform X13 [Oncorhynchus keta]XP_052322396.1 neuroepithelial cell-transforming gene 1 protein-like isoform X14 [Oncorhynchus keta]XP_052322397.1 neuroepithelial cell-transforming gene 1 protein-like isoform X15 [Oncorhynchus keta]
MEESEVGELSVEDEPKRRRISSKRTSAVHSETSPATVNNSKKPPLCRGSSFTFLTPGTPWDFSLKRKHKEPKDDDTVSLSSFDLKVKRKRKEKKEDDDTVSLSSFDLKEPSNKRVRPLSRVSSLANLISPSKNGAVRRFGQTIQNMSLRGDSKSPGASLKSCSKAAGPTPPKRRNSTLWSETLDVHQKSTFSTKEIKRQEAIHELSRGEQDLIEDLQMARKAYHDPMLKLSIMTEEELTHIFGDLDSYIPLHEGTRSSSYSYIPLHEGTRSSSYSYIPLHEDLLDKLAKGTGPNGTVGQIGQIVVDWLPGLNAYRDYCSNQLAAKALLDQKKQDRKVQDFLQRCLESPFSRKLDLWSFLDIPRSRLVKYPLLLREILRHTPPDHPDVPCLEKAIAIIQGVLSDINMRKGESESQYYINKLEYLDDRQRDPLIDNCKTLLCHGELRNKSGSKLHVFLFSELLVLTRPVTRHERSCYQVYRQPLPIRDLALEDLQDGDVRMGGSFRGAFSQGEKAKNVFRVTSLDPTHGQSHTLQVNDVFHKQQWLNCLRSAIDAQPQQQRAPLRDQHSEATTMTRAKRRSSVVSMSDMVGEGADENVWHQVGEPILGCKGTETLPASGSSSKIKREWRRGTQRRRKETGV